MKLTRSLVGIFFIILVFVASYGSWALFTENSWAQTVSVPQPELTSQIPANPNRSSYNPETQFGEFAWQAFVALNWPANCDGLPLEDKQIGEAPNAPRVWEFYNTPDRIFLANGQDPRPVLPIVPPGCQTERTLSQSTQKLGLRFTEAAGVLAKATPLEIERRTDILLPDRKALIDQSGNYILNEIRMNPIEVEEIVDKEWYSADNLREFNNTDNFFALVCSSLTSYRIYKGQLPCQKNDDVGAIELKAAWMVLPTPVPEEIESNYYTTTRTFVVEEEVSENNIEKEVTVPVALVGFHIVQKTSRQGWTWATFEHLDNAPDADNLPSDGDYNLYNPNCQENCQENKSYAKKPYLWRDEFPHAVTRDEAGKIEPQIPSQITRLVPITATAESLNSTWQQKLQNVGGSSVWQNYQLIGTQWLGTPTLPYELTLRNVQPNQGNQFSQLANVTLEPYVQKTDIGSSCIACHTNAYLQKPTDLQKGTYADFSFLLEAAQSPALPKNAE